MSRLPFQIVFLAVALPRAVLAAEPDVSESRTNTQPGTLMVTKGNVTHRVGQGAEQPASAPKNLNIGHQLHTLENAWAALTFTNTTTLRMWELTRLHLVEPTNQAVACNLFCSQGQIHVNNRGAGTNTIQFASPYGRAKPKGTEYLVMVDPDHRRMDITMFDGQAELADGNTKVTIHSGQQGTIIAGQGIEVRSVLQATNIIQWWIYYPGILDPDELGLTAAEETHLAASLTAYRSGDLPQALKQYPGYPAPPNPDSDAQRIYYAGLLLSVGAVDRAETQLRQVSASAPLARALRTMILAVQNPLAASRLVPPPHFQILNSQFSISNSASERLALSYAHQATNNLTAALAAARAAATNSPRFGLAWARVAELEFSFARTRAARAAVQNALAFTPHNAQARALNGFLLAADNRTRAALEAFDEAIRLDPALGNAWLGRGLCKRRLDWSVFGFSLSPRGTSGERAGVRGGSKSEIDQGLSTSAATRTSALDDLATAAALEPTRSLVRSYAGKAFADFGDARLAHKELDYAKTLDPNDPTPWLYSALLRREQNEINPAVRDLEHSIERNDNRAVYRSRLLLDQDRAVRSANLADLYQDAGLTDVSVREAVRAVNADYLNYSAHLFLANSYNRLRDPSQINLRYETPWFSEYLLANLLAPVGASTLSQTVSQEEYSRLFERNRLGLVSRTEYFSSGDWLQTAAQFGRLDNFAYALDATYRSENGHRPNNDLERLTISLQLKYDLTARDSLFLQGIYYDASAGDVRQYYNEAFAHPHRRAMESQRPLLLAGYHHQWAPGSDTLLLGGRLQDSLHVTDPNYVPLLLRRRTNNFVALPYPPLPTAPLDYRSDLEAWTAELQHILRARDHTLVAGARYQDGLLDTRSRLERSTVLSGLANATTTNIDVRTIEATASKAETHFQRFSVYAYDQWQLSEALLLSAGLSYERLDYPLNFRTVPNSALDGRTDGVFPKAGFIWTPGSDTTVRAAYTRSLGGVSLEQSVRLEPPQIAGFNQAYRSVIPEAVGGSVAGERFETYGLSLEKKFGAGTWLGAQIEALRSKGEQELGGLYTSGVSTYFDVPTNTTERLRYEEQNVLLTFHQLVGRDWSLGARYRWSDARLRRHLADVSPVIVPAARREEAATLQQVNLVVLFNHPSGFFSQFDAIWSHQSNRGAAASLAGDDFWQFNVFGGYRFARRRAELRVGVLNLTDQNYRLNPLNLTAELPHERTFYTSLRFSF